MKTAYWYRAMCFGKPVGPWRTERDEARRDLVEHGLGSFDEWGKFWVTVPGDLQTHAAWVHESRAA